MMKTSNSGYNFKFMSIWVAAFAVIGTAALILTQAAASATMSLSANTATATVGSSVAVTVRVGADTNEITGAQACVTYDATRLTVVRTDTSTSPLTNTIPSSDADCDAGQVQISRFATTPATSTFTLGIITFTVIKEGSTPIALNVDLAKSYVRDNATTDTTGNYINILAGSTGAVLTPPTVPPTPPPAPPVVASATMALSPATASVAKNATVAITVQVKAGTNQITGAQACVTYDSTKLTLTTTDTSTSPLDSTIPSSSADCAAGQAMISRFSTNPATGTFTLGVLTFRANVDGTTAALGFDSAKSYVRDNATTDSAGNYANILTGSTGATLTLPATNTPPPPAPGSASMLLTPATGSVTNGSTIALTVQVKAGTSKITGAQACVTYDSAKLTLTNTDTSTSPLTNVIPSSSADCAVGQAMISRFDTAPATGTFTLGILTFTAKQGSTTTSLSFDSAKSYVRDNATTDSAGNYVNILSGTTGSTLTLNGIPTPPPTPITVASNIVNGQTLSGNATWTAATTGPGITKVEFYVDGAIKYTDASAPYQFNGDPGGRLNTQTLTNASHILRVMAYNASGNVSDTVSVRVQNGDSTAPSVPASLAAVAASATQVNLSWHASTDAIGVTGYWVLRNGVTVAKVGVVTTYTDAAVSPNTEYSYQVIAHDAAGNNSAASLAAIVKTPQAADTQAPSVPTSLTATATSSSQINLAWTASTDNTKVDGYEVYRALGTAQAARVATVATNSFGDSGLVANTSYSYYVVARDAANNASAHSATVTAKTLIVSPTAVKGSLTGTITNEKGSKLPWVLITINVKDGRHFYVSNSQGAYSIPRVSAGTYTVRYFSYKYAIKTVTVTIPEGTRVVQNVTLVKR